MYSKFIHIIVSCFIFLSCHRQAPVVGVVRDIVDTVGFAQYPWQMDSIMARMDDNDKRPSGLVYKAVICPHDDYTYAAGLYNKTLTGVRAKTVVLIGVAHRARNFQLENKLVFGTFSEWRSANGNIPVSALRNELVGKMNESNYVIQDSLMQTEHSLEAINPFLQRNIEGLTIIPILVPAMTFENMLALSDTLALALNDLMESKNLEYGKDLAIVISNDAVHYGNTDWGRDDLAPYGVDSTGNAKAKQKDRDIISECLLEEVSQEKIKAFNQYTVQDSDYREYKWVWCGRYSVPFGLLVADRLNHLSDSKSLHGELIGYRNSLDNKHIIVSDLGMGQTAPASPTHWVGYVGVGYQ